MDDLRTLCKEKYGEDFVKDYDKLNRGEPIGNLLYTMNFLTKLDTIKSRNREKVLLNKDEDKKQ